MNLKTIQQLGVGLAVGAALILGSVSCGSDSGDGRETVALTRLDPEQFEARMGNPPAHRGSVRVINVHIPYEGELENTDAFIPFDRILEDPQLPGDRDSEILLYCRSGRMSGESGGVLIQAGYTNVSHLEGGMKAWEAAGRRLVHRPQDSEPAAG